MACSPTYSNNTPLLITSFIEDISKGVEKPNEQGQLCCPVCKPHILCNKEKFDNLVILCEHLGISLLCNVRAYPQSIEDDYLAQGFNVVHNSDFTEQIARLETILSPTEFAYIVEKGIVEYSIIVPGKSEVGTFIDFLLMEGFNTGQISSTFYDILNNGVVTFCENGNLYCMSLCLYSEYIDTPT